METFGRISKEMGFEERIEVKKMLNYIFTTCSVYVVCVCVCVCVLLLLMFYKYVRCMIMITMIFTNFFLVPNRSNRSQRYSFLLKLPRFWQDHHCRA
jgi:hypothetical protein